MRQLFPRQMLSEAFRHCLKRFPATTAFVSALTVWLLYLCWDTEGRFSERLMYTLIYYLSAGSVLTLTLRLWGEEVKSRRRRAIVNALCHAALIADAAYLYLLPGNTLTPEVWLAHASLITALVLSVPLLPFLRDEDDTATWYFALQLLRNLIISSAVGWLLCGGLCLLTASLSGLFGWEVDSNWYITWTVACSLWLPALLFLGRTPEGDGKHVRADYTPAFVQKVIRWLFLPLIGCYLLVLYAYLVKNSGILFSLLISLLLAGSALIPEKTTRDTAGVNVEITYVEDYGNRIGYYFSLGEQEVISIMPEHVLGDVRSAFWSINYSRLHFFDAETTDSIGDPEEYQ